MNEKHDHGVRAVDAPLPQRELDALLDHIYEHGTAAEGVRPLAVKLCQAYAASGVAVDCKPCGNTRTELWGKPCRFCTDGVAVPQKGQQ